jgi:hypothetical protein
MIDLQPAHSRKLSALVPTSDDWYPNYEGNCVEVSLIDCRNDPSHEPWCRIWVSGSDDFAMVKDFSGSEYDQAKSEAESLPVPIAIAQLRTLGFTRH